VGSHVWVEDADVAWIDGLVEEVHGDELIINCSSGKKVNKIFLEHILDYFYSCQ
jgi:hypothetical protein